jgi:hypothetical protein
LSVAAAPEAAAVRLLDRRVEGSHVLPYDFSVVGAVQLSVR